MCLGANDAFFTFAFNARRKQEEMEWWRDFSRQRTFDGLVALAEDADMRWKLVDFIKQVLALDDEGGGLGPREQQRHGDPRGFTCGVVGCAVLHCSNCPDADTFLNFIAAQNERRLAELKEGECREKIQALKWKHHNKEVQRSANIRFQRRQSAIEVGFDQRGASLLVCGHLSNDEELFCFECNLESPAALLAPHATEPTETGRLFTDVDAFERFAKLHDETTRLGHEQQQMMTNNAKQSQQRNWQPDIDAECKRASAQKQLLDKEFSAPGFSDCPVCSEQSDAILQCGHVTCSRCIDSSDDSCALCRERFAVYCIRTT